MFAKYIEIYTTLDMEKCFRVKNLLAENNISYKVRKVHLPPLKRAERR